MSASDEDRGAGRQDRYRSLFWPILLIGLGLVLLLGELGVIERASGWALLRLWPVVLIVAGLDLLFAGRAPLVGALLGILTVVGALVLLLWGGRAGWLPSEPLRIGGLTFLDPADVKHDTYRAPLAGHDSADLELHLGAFQTLVRALDGADDLIVAELDHIGEITWRVTGDSKAQVVLDEESRSVGWLGWRGAREPYMWDVALTARVPIEALVVDASSGRADLDLRDLDVRRLTLDASSGAVSAQLPATIRAVEYSGSSGHVEMELADEAACEFVVEMSSGALELMLGEDSDVQLEVRRGSSGALTLTLARGAALRVEVRDSSSGSVQLPRELDEIERGDDDEGVWQSADWGQGARGVQLVIDDMSSGSVKVVYR